jgi:hypothetical protein
MRPFAGRVQFAAACVHANTCRVLPSFGKAGFINGQDSRLLAQLLKRVGAQIIAHALSVPHSAGEQALHAIGARFSSMFSQLPAIFALDGTQDALQILERSATRLWSGKASSNARMQMG